MKPEPSQDISDIIGMIIAFIAVIYAVLSTIFGLFKKKKEGAEEVDDEAQERQKLLKEIFEPYEEEEEEIEEEEEPVHHAHPLPPPPPAPVLHTEPVIKERWQQQKERFVFHPHMDEFRQRTAIEDRKLDIHLRSGEDLISESIKIVPKYEVTGKKTESPLKKLIQSVPSKKSWIILSEIINAPIGTRKNKSQYW